MDDAWHQRLGLSRAGVRARRTHCVPLVANSTTAVAVGLLGAYTTFSTFGYENFELLRTQQTATAVIYVVLSLLGGLVATAVGYATGKAML